MFGVPMASYGIAFITFDFRQGPVVPFHENLTPDFCEKIGIKVLMAGLAGHGSNQSSNYVGESITPFPEEQKLVFSYLFPITSSDLKEPRPSALALVFPQGENELLYRIAPALSKQFFAQISVKLQGSYVFGKELPKDIRRELVSLLNKETLSKFSTGSAGAKKITYSTPFMIHSDEEYSKLLKDIHQTLLNAVGPMAKVIMRKAMKEVGISKETVGKEPTDLAPLLQAILDDLSKAGVMDENQLSVLNRQFISCLGFSALD